MTYQQVTLVHKLKKQYLAECLSPWSMKRESLRIDRGGQYVWFIPQSSPQEKLRTSAEAPQS